MNLLKRKPHSCGESLWCGTTVSLLALVMASAVCHCANAQEPTRRSAFGEYSGYSSARFDQWINQSQYVEMRDGVRLAVDIVRPSVGGQAIDDKLPVVWTHSRYHRSPQAIMKQFGSNQADRIQSMVDVSPDLQRLVRHGYAIAAVGVRGSGASFGRNEGLFSPNETRDAKEIIQWLANQPWCDGNVGMHGGSYLGMTQYMAASQAPAALKAIFPNVAGFDLYDVVYPGGVFRQDMVRHWGQLTRNLDELWLAPKVQTDTDGQLLRQAVAQHQDNYDVIKEYRAAKFRDTDAWLVNNLSPYLAQINEARVPAYHWCGWDDIFVADALIWFANYQGPQKLGVGSWPHASTPDPKIMMERTRLRTVEQHRWFDYWLKGIDNQVMDEPPVHYATLDDPGQWRWQAAEQWPLPSSQIKITEFYFDAGPSNSVKSVNDGQLTPDKSVAADGAKDVYRIDLTTTTGTASRWDNAVGVGPMNYPEMQLNDEKCLTYTTATLQHDVVVTGHPQVVLFVTSTAEDADFYVLLEEVDGDGKSRYVTEGVLRASHRATSAAPWNNLGLPFQRSYQQDKNPLPTGKITKLEFDLHPVSNLFNAGHRIRVAVMGADQDNTEAPPVGADATFAIYRDDNASRILLPVAVRQ